MFRRIRIFFILSYLIILIKFYIYWGVYYNCYDYKINQIVSIIK